MGDEIDKGDFEPEDFARFKEHLAEETELIHELFDTDAFSQRGEVAGFELEVWLVDQNCQPVAANKEYLAALNNPLVVPELSAFNIELNGSPTRLAGRTFSRLRDELSATWRDCNACAETMGYDLVTIGILPTVTRQHLTPSHMSGMVRYHALNDQVIKLRDGKPVVLDIDGDEPLHLTHDSVMLEAAATSFQIHLQCKPEDAVNTLNAACIASAPLVAVAANSPFLFGHALWEETRIPVFEQAVSLGSKHRQRVFFGSGYANHSLYELFQENLEEFDILLPAPLNDPPSSFCHTRFHNGTIWRWNRPLLGFDFDGQPHLRIEHRVIPAGPTITDCIANAAFYFGLVRALVLQRDAMEKHLAFDTARGNFYTAARHGLKADLLWSDGREMSAERLLLDELIPLAAEALESSQIPKDEVADYLGIIEERIKRRQNGAIWQRKWIARHGRDFSRMTAEYLKRQKSDAPYTPGVCDT